MDIKFNKYKNKNGIGSRSLRERVLGMPGPMGTPLRHIPQGEVPGAKQLDGGMQDTIYRCVKTSVCITVKGDKMCLIK